MYSDATRKTIRQQLDTGDGTGAWKELRRVAEEDVPPNEQERLGALIAKRVDALRAIAGQVERVALLGQFTTNWLANALCFAAAADGALVEPFIGEYDNVIGDLSSPELEKFAPQTLVLAPWHRGLLQRGPASADARIEQELEFWQQAWKLAGKLGARIVQLGYDWVHPGPLGYHLDSRADGHVGRIQRMNDALRQRLPPGAYFIDLPLVSGDIGRRAMYDLRGYHWTKNPLSAGGTAWLAKHIWAGTRALKAGSKKVVVLDLDNTLWGGVVGELGALDVALGDSPDGEAFRAFQGHLLGLAERGVLLTVSSKNNEEDATEPFEKNPSMVLRREHLSAFEANWEPKSYSLARIAEKLRLGLDSFVFVDDSPAERSQVRLALPEVRAPELPEEPAELARTLISSLLFETASVTEADKVRVEQYRQDQLRDATQRSFETFDEYLRSLELRGKANRLEDAHMLRAAQLVAKTNQFNLTNRRHDRQQLERIRAQDGAVCLTLELADRFGDYGLIGLLLAAPAPDGALEIDTWLLSCRALNRTAEHFFFAELCRVAAAAGVTRLTGSYVPSKKNGQVAELLPGLGFRLLGEDETGVRRFELTLAGTSPPTTFVLAE